MFDELLDSRLRAGAFARLRWILARHGDIVPFKALAAPFDLDGIEMRLMNKARGIWKPRTMQAALSVKTVVPRPGRAKRYADQHAATRAFEGGDAPFHYALQGSETEAHDNRALLAAYEHQRPLIWFLGVGGALYRPVAPVFVDSWQPDRLRVALVPGSAALGAPELQEPPTSRDERRYSLRAIKQRLHQSLFRQRDW